MTSATATTVRLSFSATFSMAVHIAIALFLLTQTPKISDKIENGIRAFNMKHVSIAIKKPEPVAQIHKSKKSPIKKPEVKAAQTNEQVINNTVEEPEKNVEKLIPVVKNANFEGVRQPPIYPKRSIRLRQQGTVILKALVSADGEIQQLDLDKSSGYPSLDQSAINAVNEWTFKPTYIDGEPILSWIEVPVEFKLR